ncbi:MAG: DUF5615 family PIN-like protein [Chloroflexaceae bacterium]|nr:DUF5615 family PIN-like protein [Chloroflexaceae bacterium]NJL33558.1 DUF5615 family PIN-like protein [Chloroflexaceae bacterium]NJO07525.1 DUF5615 family PIN-like protein [Chloroflexaceae bacterium]
MNVRFLLDENLSPSLKQAVSRYNPAIDVLRVGDEDAPPLGTLDPDILTFLEQSQRALITDNRRSMPAHIATHYSTGGEHWGIFLIRAGTSMRDTIEALILLWEASDAEEWRNVIRWIP